MSNTRVYPNGQELVSSALSLDAIQQIIQQLTLAMLGLPVTPDSSAVRIEYQSEGAPFQNKGDDICYVTCKNATDEPYDKYRDELEIFNDGDSDTNRQAQTRSWVVYWTCYGPSSTQNARAIRSALYQDYFTGKLADSQLFPVSDFKEPVRAPEYIDGQWFERVDFDALFYEFVVETIEDPTVVSVDVSLNTNAGEVAEVTVTIEE